ncbi:DUF3467 domain-containing protein [Candidatus Woesearchaeota archaeon]|nr:DUF3467 domain-containing protein [Candidatus Woesearchaeota archaeon]
MIKRKKSNETKKKKSNLTKNTGKTNLSINQGRLFYSNEVGIAHNPVNFFIDFKSISPRVDIRNRDYTPMVMEHNTIAIDPFMAQELLGVLEDSIKKYENTFGKIKKPKSIDIANNLSKNKKKASAESTHIPSYFG